MTKKRKNKRAKDAFTGIDPFDGIKVERVDLGEMGLSLHAVCVQDGVTSNFGPHQGEAATALIAEWESPTPEDYGACDRLEAVAAAVARYLTFGGTWDELVTTLSGLQRFSPDTITYPGYYYAGCSPLEAGKYSHTFVDLATSTEAVVWAEGRSIERMPLADLMADGCSSTNHADDSIWWSATSSAEGCTAIEEGSRVPRETD